MTNNEKALEKYLEIEVCTLADLERITVFCLCWGHTFHLFLLKQQNINYLEKNKVQTQLLRSYLIREVLLYQLEGCFVDSVILMTLQSLNFVESTILFNH